MGKDSVVELRAQIEQAQQALARAQGEQASIEKDVEQALVRLRQLLECEPGEEKEAVQELREEIVEAEQEIRALLDKANALRASVPA